MLRAGQWLLFGGGIYVNYFGGANGEGLRSDFVRKLGRGDETSFWLDVWVGEECLSVKFPRLFRLSSQKNYVISDMGGWVNQVWEWDLKWTRSISSRNRDQLDVLLSVIVNCKLSLAGVDYWHWKFASNGAYNTAAAYDLLRR